MAMTVLDYVAASSVAIGLKAYGTSEGSSKGWDTRGRSQGSKLRDHVKQGKFKGGWKHGGRNEGEGYRGHFTTFFDHPKYGLLEIKHGGPFRENPVTVKHNGTGVFTGGHDKTRAFLRTSYGIRYGGPNEQG